MLQQDPGILGPWRETCPAAFRAGRTESASTFSHLVSKPCRTIDRMVEWSDGWMTNWAALTLYAEEQHQLGASAYRYVTIYDHQGSGARRARNPVGLQYAQWC